MHAFKKLHEQSGLSLAIALLIFLACAMAGATILSAATASEDAIENTVWTMAQTVSASKQSSDESLDFTITSDDTSEVIHADMSMDKDYNLKIQLTKNRDNHTSYLNVRIAGSAYVDPSGTVKTVSWKDDNPRITRRKVCRKSL